MDQVRAKNICVQQLLPRYYILSFYKNKKFQLIYNYKGPTFSMSNYSSLYKYKLEEMLKI